MCATPTEYDWIFVSVRICNSGVDYAAAFAEVGRLSQKRFPAGDIPITGPDLWGGRGGRGPGPPQILCTKTNLFCTFWGPHIPSAPGPPSG